MAIGTEELIVQAVERLLMQKKVKKLTVKDIVEECGITRQTFYYHFRDIPDLLKWVLERNTDQLLKEMLAQGNAEKGLRCLFLLALNTRPYVRAWPADQLPGRNYADGRGTAVYLQVAERHGLYAQCSHWELKLVMRYHSQAVLGILRSWSEADSDDLDHIVHVVHQLIVGEISPRQ